MLEYLLQVIFGFVIQFGVLNKQWFLVLMTFIAMLLWAIYSKPESYAETIAFFIGVIGATYYVGYVR